MAEKLTEWLAQVSPEFPRITPTSRSQMKDVEFVANLLLFSRKGRRGIRYLSSTGPTATGMTTGRDRRITRSIRKAAYELIGIINHADGGAIKASRMRNQSDFYSLFGASDSLRAAGTMPSIPYAINRLSTFLEVVEDEDKRGMSHFEPEVLRGRSVGIQSDYKPKASHRHRETSSPRKLQGR